MFTYGFLFAWYSFSWHLQMARQIVFTESGFWKYSWAHLVMSMTESCRWVMQCCLRAWRPRASNLGLRPCPLRTEISPVTLTPLMLCTVDNKICKAFAIWHWGTLFLKYFTILATSTSSNGYISSVIQNEQRTFTLPKNIITDFSLAQILCDLDCMMNKSLNPFIYTARVCDALQIHGHRSWSAAPSLNT